MSHARNVKTSPGKAAGTKCVKVYPQIQIRLREQAFFSPYKKLNIRLDKFSCFIYIHILDIFMQGFQLEKNLVESKSTVEN